MKTAILLTISNVFMTFAWNYAVGFLLMIGAVFFIFKK